MSDWFRSAPPPRAGPGEERRGPSAVGGEDPPGEPRTPPEGDPVPVTGPEHARRDAPSERDGVDTAGTPRSGEEETRRAEGATTDAAEHLNAAITELEDVLSERHGVAPGPPSATLEGNVQYTIPLLDDVVLPGGQPPAEAAGEDEDDEAAEPLFDHAVELRAFADEAGAYRPVLDRLASEIEVIVQAGVDEALKDAARAIRRRVNEHLEIVLPEILDELARKDRRQG